ncbi:MAG: hypothetical protein A4E19_03750 [Nitrospira sp. SG-bin1]|nr:MAG: hypothetical protein A4E19_03750 [Nitrospira sp. SG-bin1]
MWHKDSSDDGWCCLTPVVGISTIPLMTKTISADRLPRGWFAAGLLCTIIFYDHAGAAKDLLAPKQQETTEIGSTESQSFDDQEKGVPLSIFTWIKLAKGFEVEWDTFGRKGWYTQDPRLKPIEPGSTFTPETPAIYLVFEVAPLEDPAQFGVQWYLEQSSGLLNERPLGKDVLEVPGHERYGYLELKRSNEKWAVGHYVAKIYVTPLGQQPFHAANQVGLMHFKIKDADPALSQDEKAVR